jgi:5-formyltetrahydrofolate cyclo-ligase
MAPTWRYWRQRIFRETTHGGSANIIYLGHGEVMTDKAELRRSFRKRRNEFLLSLGHKEKSIAFSVVPSPLKSLFQVGKTVAAYVASGSEVDPMPILGQAASIGCITALPHVQSRSAPMQFLKWSPGEMLQQGAFGLMQPVTTSDVVVPDIILLPLLAFDKNLTRLGQGAGHYDRALSQIDQFIAVGLGWSVQMAELLPADPWDIPMDAVLTEKEWIAG